MNALVRKEIRLLLPVWVAAVLQAVLPTVIFWSIFQELPPEPLLYVPFGLGILLLGLTSFGYEFGTGTFSIFLAQPIPRLQIWRLKTRLLAVALFSVWFAVAVSLCVVTGMQGRFSSHFPGIVNLEAFTAIMTLTVFSSVLWTTLLFRQVAAAFWFTILIPSFISVFLWSALEKKSEPQAFAGVFSALLLYSLAGFLWARWMFMRAQDTAWTGGDISLPAWLGFRTQAPAQAVVPKLKPLRALVRKEFQSHHITLLIAALLLVSHLVGIAVRKLEYDPTSPHKGMVEIFGFWWLLWFALPMVIGATVVAEERKLGTLEGQLCLPVKPGWQFTVKLVMALLLGVFLGGVMPAICEGIGTWAGVPGEFPAVKNPEFWVMLSVCCVIATGITLVSVYASTLTRNLLQALGTAVLVGLGLAAFGVVLVQQEHFSTSLWLGLLGIYLGVPILVATLLWLGFKNFKSLQVGLNLWNRNFLAILAAMIFIVVATTQVWNRVWEVGMTLEPAHGPVRLTGPVQPSLDLVWGGKLFALLPDGRVWMETKYQILDVGKERINMNGEETTQKIQTPIPTGGIFLAGSNWVQLANFSDALMGLKSDGSLWRIFRTLRMTNQWANLSTNASPERLLGTDSDWKVIAGGWGGFYALKQNGSLWAWHQESQNFKQLGQDSGWTALFGSSQNFAGIKRDGSVWKWGWLEHGPYSNQILEKGWIQEHRKPVEFYPAGGDWQVIDDDQNFDLLIKRDGTLWASGYLPENLFSNKANPARSYRGFSAEPVQIGTEVDFVDVKSRWGRLIALNKTGVIYLNEFFGPHLALRGSLRKPSTYSDWIAIQRGDWSQADLALAADGTLSAWGDLRNGSHNLLGPSRAPLWTLNIFAEAK